MIFLTVAMRREREQAIRRSLIIEAAQKLFEQKGFEATSVDEIANAAELGKGTIYSYFKSKEEIYIAILEKGMEILKERMNCVVNEPIPATEALIKLYDTFVNFLGERKSFIESMLNQSDAPILYRLGSLANGLKNRSPEWQELVSRVIERGIKDGEFQSFQVEQMAKIIIALIIGLIIQYETGQVEKDLNEYRDTVFLLVLKGISHP
jgi:AcrR family transcriptional regulator